MQVLPRRIITEQFNDAASDSCITGGSWTRTKYTYDALNRVVGESVNGASQSTSYDGIGRVTSIANPLDTFSYAYSDGTSRVTGVSSSHGPEAALTYFGPQGDELLQQLNFATHSGTMSLAQFGYTYNSDDNVASLTVSSPSAQTASYDYDADNRLASGLISGSIPQYQYGYDDASNLTAITPNGPTESYSYTPTNAIAGSTYDLNGSPTALAGNTYIWDGANRIVEVSNAVAHTSSSFTYDGLGRLVRIIDSKSGVVIGDHSYFWCGTRRCLAHDNRQNGEISAQYFSQGEIVSGTAYYYVKDQLGSVTELVTATGNVAAQYQYDPFGNRNVVSGTIVSDVGYAGYFYHANSGLEFAIYRAYDSQHGRWLNRDPVGEEGGLNLYAYVQQNPLSETDSNGTDPIIGATVGLIAGAIQGGLGAAIQGGSWRDIVEASVIGGVVGVGVGLIDPSLGVGTLAFVGGVSGGFGDLIGQKLAMHGESCKSINWGSTVGAVVGGAISGYGGTLLGNLGAKGSLGAIGELGDWANTSFGAAITSPPSVFLPVTGAAVWNYGTSANAN